MAWSPDSSHVVTGDGEGKVRFWSDDAFDPVDDLTLASTEMQGGIAANGVAFWPDGGRVIAGSALGTAVKMWDVGVGGDAEWANLPTAGYYGDVDFLPDGQRVVAVDRENQMRVWDLETGRPGDPIGPPIEWENRFDLSPDGSSIAFGRSPVVTAWDVQSGNLLFSHRFPRPSKIERVDWSPRGIPRRGGRIRRSRGHDLRPCRERGERAAGPRHLDRRGSARTAVSSPRSVRKCTSGIGTGARSSDRSRGAAGFSRSARMVHRS